MRAFKVKPRKTARRLQRTGAILLDLFLATLIFSICVIAIGQFGSQSLQVARATAVERMAGLKAESALAKEIAFGPHKNPKIWKETLQGIPFTIHATWHETPQRQLQRVTVEVASNADLNLRRNTVSLSRLVFIGEDK